MQHLASLHAFSHAYSEADSFGKMIFIGLYLLSIICWATLLYKYWQLRAVAKASYAFQEAIETKKKNLLRLELGELPQMRSANLPHPFAAIFFSLKQKTLEVFEKNLYFCSQEGKTAQAFLTPQDLDLLEGHVHAVISHQSKRLEHNLFILATAVTLSPFLGLLGTVWGILITFSELGSGGTIGSNSAILSGLSTALAATVLGLLIAIPALIAYNYLKHLSRTLTSDMENFLTHLLSTIELQYRK